MPSTYTDNGGIELPANGEQASTWGNTVNDNMNIIDRLTNGVGAITLSGTTHTLTTSDGTPSDGHYKVLILGGSPSGTNTITVAPNNGQHIYIVRNASGQTAIFTQGSGSNVSVANNTNKIIYANGAGSGAAVVDITGSLDLGALVIGGVAVTSTAAELNILDGVTATTAELNIMDGVTSSTAEINKLDGFTGVVADLNYAKDLRATGVTTSEFDVLDGVTATTAELNIMDGVTATTAELNIMDGVTATTAEINIMDGVTATTAEINYVDGVTSNVQTQINTKAANTTQAASVWETGTSTTETIVSPAKVKSAIVELTPAGLGVDQTWQDFSSSGRSVSTSYQNTTGAPIMVCIGGGWNGSDATPFEVSNNGSTWIGINRINSGGTLNGSAVIPNNGYYRFNGSSFDAWAELR